MGLADVTGASRNRKHGHRLAILIGELLSSTASIYSHAIQQSTLPRYTHNKYAKYILLPHLIFSVLVCLFICFSPLLCQFWKSTIPFYVPKPIILSWVFFLNFLCPKDISPFPRNLSNQNILMCKCIGDWKMWPFSAWLWSWAYQKQSEQS